MSNNMVINLLQLVFHSLTNYLITGLTMSYIQQKRKNNNNKTFSYVILCIRNNSVNKLFFLSSFFQFFESSNLLFNFLNQFFPPQLSSSWFFNVFLLQNISKSQCRHFFFKFLPPTFQIFRSLKAKSLILVKLELADSFFFFFCAKTRFKKA